VDAKAPAGTACEDGFQCTSGESCLNGACLPGTRHDNLCDDNNACNGVELCDPAFDRGDHSGCSDPPDLACDLCTTELFQGVGPTCDPLSGCVADARPRANCDNASVAGTDLVADPETSFNDKLKFSWGGHRDDNSVFGDPRDSTRYALCYYDGLNSSMEPEFATSFSVEPDAFRWKKATSGKLTYNEHFGEQDGIMKILLFANDDGDTKIKIRGRGDTLNLPTPVGGGDFFAVQDEVIAQVVNDNGSCWEAHFNRNTVRRNIETSFSAKVRQ
jgi:hypothetical protein